jgi:hypothetical protein
MDLVLTSDFKMQIRADIFAREMKYFLFRAISLATLLIGASDIES